MNEPNVFTDLVADGDDLDVLLADLPAADFARPTPAPGWTIAHQVAHLAATFRLAGMAAADPGSFGAVMASLSEDFTANVAHAMAEYLAESPALLLQRWQAERATTEKALSTVDPDAILPWLVRPLPARVLAAAGMMELFAHGQDIADALGRRRHYTDRVGHLVGFAVRTWDFGYLSRGLTPPVTEFRFELIAPSGATWSYGPPDASERIAGSAVDFCLLASRRRHRADLDLVATGVQADRWLDIAQAYRGPAGAGRQPGQFATAAH